ncbi:MAG: NADH:ubiquinone reductase (Na(+)-transporting) subunit B [Pseudomonadales bacterium]|jgi:Na+-transporting NADH:ubiquinone oxidoreductase subunit B|nr:NADH:ubiquinone reductase (Na(+)-transporting) subunit B [Pseudomonadales bacterium]MDP6471362.1 NADH:ubiquinone reductase (Na(+)-transporting) subunit B [Pseudomonadales bacterium]MDP6826446.1 NADH:ubiquinone reductase (Na(+)-transporting) subunit B [Pseudomonadales bacterium]MDP6970999.1 NADH:ubiquinone reductase (Na(+)-transporting) subunit B [Pseudomonadales bacterium]|tara:strand:+ start:479 stop:1660 length:1182 start_codon:yes stop_codon:yes gene_type:complete
MLRRILDRVAPHFEEEGRLSALFPVYEAIDTALFTPGHVTGGASHVRDGLDLKRLMLTVWFAAWIPVFVGSYIVGFQANEAMQVAGLASTDNWRAIVLDALINYDHTSMWDNFLHGLAYFIPLYVVVFLVGIAFEVWFASKRGHEINEGFFVTSILFTLTLPPGTPLWMAAVGIAFGVVIGKEVFGGVGKNFLNPALTGRAFLYFAYPAQMSGDAVWVAVDGFTRATPLGNAAIGEAYGIDFWQAFFGNMAGSFGETSTPAILVAAVILLVTRVASWRIMLGCVLGLVGAAWLFNMIPSSNPMFTMTPAWHLVLGGFAFGAVFMATDPVSAAMTDTGRLVYGILIGVMCVLIRVVNPAFPEGMMLAILFGNLFAPLIDHFVTQSNIKRRIARG